MLATAVASFSDVLVAKKSEKSEGDGQSRTLGIPSEIHQAFSDLCDRRGLKIRAAAGRVLSWLLSRPASVQSAVLGIRDGMEASYADVLQGIVDDLRKAEEMEIARRGEEIGEPTPPSPQAEREDGGTSSRSRELHRGRKR